MVIYQNIDRQKSVSSESEGAIGQSDLLVNNTRKGVNINEKMESSN